MIQPIGHSASVEQGRSPASQAEAVRKAQSRGASVILVESVGRGRYGYRVLSGPEPAAEDAAVQGTPPGTQETKDASEKKRGQFDRNECKTCEERKYQDGSDDPGVSFKTPQHISPESAASAVRAHEMEHVYRNRAKAEREGREVVSQNVTLHTGICPECGRAYVSGGTTRTVTRDKSDEVAEVLQRSQAPVTE